MTQANPNEFVSRRVDLFTGVFKVEPLKFRYEIFTIEKSDVRPHVLGHFSATGGAEESIQVVLAEKEECERWLAGSEAILLFSTDRIKEGKIDFTIGAPGTYCLALSNKHSRESAKTVAADLELVYLVPSRNRVQ